jgi:ketosteroid isomerase-like protein
VDLGHADVGPDRTGRLSACDQSFEDPFELLRDGRDLGLGVEPDTGEHLGQRPVRHPAFDHAEAEPEERRTRVGRALERTRLLDQQLPNLLVLRVRDGRILLTRSYFDPGRLAELLR